jgi:hypothetical protein
VPERLMNYNLLFRYNLNINLYMEIPKLEIDIQAEITKLCELEAKRAEAENEMNECLRALGVPSIS